MFAQDSLFFFWNANIATAHSIPQDAHGQDCYGTYKAEGKYLECKRTKGISTTDLIQRILLPEGRATEEIDEGCLEILVNEFAKSVPYPFPVIRYNDLISSSDFDAVRKLWPAGRKIVYVGGGWDCFGSGHVEYLRRCKELLGAGGYPGEAIAAIAGEDAGRNPMQGTSFYPFAIVTT
ncbi:hypothetical protein Clacol_008190 [Clathrus columnatus]|uniref:Rhodanese domain-containing protein n=1 Tax=Clathrus columnatus TaxID=1419009 RepID=A0AAV5AML5_9AGAM|nr:hypothetical protein Clacol_008190 [Clathrus columnatus]